MKHSIYLAFFIVLLITSVSHSQDQKILVFDPNGASTSFQFTFSQLTEDSVFVADTIDNTIFNYDALFLFIAPPYLLSQEECIRLIQYSTDNRPIYIFICIFPGGIDTVAFWNHIGVEEMYGLLLSVPVTTVFGVSGQFTNGVIIDTSFMSGLIPEVVGNVDSILVGDGGTWEVNTTYISGYDSLNVVIDLYNLIDDYDFLQRVLEQFELILPNDVKDQFNLIADFILFQNYPNPFNPTTKIKYTIPSVTLRQDQSDNWITLKVYDILGNEITTLVNEEKQAGTYEIEFSTKGGSTYSGDTYDLPSGIYLYQPKTGNYVETQKMVLIK